MEINVRVEDPGNASSLRSLQTWLSNDTYVQVNAQPELRKSGSQRMTDLATIELVLTFGFKFANLAFQIRKWMRESASSAPLVVTPQGGSPTTVKPADDMNQILRALVGAPDPRKSACVLVGISEYKRPSQLPQVEANLIDLRNVLLDPGVWGIPADKLKVVANPRTLDSITEAIAEVSRDATDTLLVYYAGHGLLGQVVGDGQQRELLIALPDASEQEDSRTAPWEKIAQKISDSDCRRKIVWLDCCFAGLAIPGNSASKAESDSAELRTAAQVADTYILAATLETASSSSDSGCTAFTGELVKILRNGVEPGRPVEEFLNLNAIRREVTAALRTKRLPEPSRDDPGRIGAYPLFHNALEGQASLDLTGRNSNPIWRWLKEHRTKGTAIVASFVLIVVAALVAYLLVPGQKVSGLDLAKYCSTLTPGGAQPLFVADTTCARPIDLNAACAFSYETTDAKALQPTPDPNSAECISDSNPAMIYGGISNMGGYCQEVTKAPAVTASPNNAIYPGKWTCQVDIDLDLACDAQNNRGDLTSVTVGRSAWDCHEAHIV